jgi:hypothetical protein
VLNDQNNVICVTGTVSGGPPVLNVGGMTGTVASPRFGPLTTVPMTGSAGISAVVGVKIV